LSAEQTKQSLPSQHQQSGIGSDDEDGKAECEWHVEKLPAPRGRELCESAHVPYFQLPVVSPRLPTPPPT
jgi:hypothetical protein